MRCTKCGLEVRYGENRELISDDESFNFKYVADWYEYQQQKVLSLDLSSCVDTPVYEDCASLTEVVPYTKKILLCEMAQISLFANRITVTSGEEKREYLFDEVSSVAVLGKNKLNIYIGKQVFQLKGDKRFNALKYIHIFHSYGQTKGETNGKRTLAI